MDANSRIKFSPLQKSLFYTTLKKRVDLHFEQNHKSRYANRTMIVKSVVLVAAYIVPFILLLVFTPPFWTGLLFWVVMGFGISGIGMSVMHDANHGAFSKNPKVNKWIGNTLYLAGAGVMNWKVQHNVLHHTYTNVPKVDQDIQDRGIVKLAPKSEVGPLHRFQWFYAFFFYGLLTFYWVILKDFVQYYSFTSSGLIRQSRGDNIRMLLGLITMKLIYFGILIALPILVFQFPALEILTGFALMHFTAGLLLTVIFQLAHSVEGTSYPVASESGILEKDWATHQLETTVNFSPDNKWLSWYIGGLNFQIEHHLFPKICHVHYPAIAPIVRQTAKEFGLDYLENKTFLSALKSHVSSLRRFGTPPVNEAIG